ncbi:hypothetical protein PWT90_01422 [Aphanocladium album]|nr:hypothetical protein PWT90_01422 [Aphanocladium album]
MSRANLGTNFIGHNVFVPADQLPPGSQGILFYIVARFRNNRPYPLAVLAQTPPSDRDWKIVDKAFIVDAALRIHHRLSDAETRTALAKELETAHSFYQNGREPLLPPVGQPGVTPAQDRAAMLAHPTFAQAARVLLHCVPSGDEDGAEQFWTPVALNTTVTRNGCSVKAVVFDITDLDSIACGVVGMVPVPAGFFGDFTLYNRVRQVVSLPSWEETVTANEHEEDGDRSAAEVTSTFPDIPVVNDDILQMLWGEAEVTTGVAASDETRAGSPAEDPVFSSTTSVDAVAGSQSSNLE